MSTTFIMPQSERFATWFGFAAGGLAWLVHLVSLSVIAEFGYFAGMERYAFLGITSVAWMVLAVSLMMAAVAMLATVLALRSYRRLHRQSVSVFNPTYHFLSRSGAYLSATFLFIIVVETIPVLFYLTIR